MSEVVKPLVMKLSKCWLDHAQDYAHWILENVMWQTLAWKCYPRIVPTWKSWVSKVVKWSVIKAFNAWLIIVEDFNNSTFKIVPLHKRVTEWSRSFANDASSNIHILVSFDNFIYHVFLVMMQRINLHTFAKNTEMKTFFSWPQATICVNCGSKSCI